MQESELIETLEAVPRNYGLAYRIGDKKFYFFPANHIMGNALRTSPDVLERLFAAVQKFHQRGHDYELYFPWPKDLLKDEQVYATFREAVKKREGTYTLLDYYPHEAVSNLKLRGDVLTANVGSKSGSGPHFAALRNIHLGIDGEFDLVDMECTCMDHMWSRQKGTTQTIAECLHIAAMEQEANERQKFGDRQKTPMAVSDQRDMKRPFFSPFRFVKNWYIDANGRLMSRSRDKAALELDVLVAHYLKGTNFYEINQDLLMLQNIYSTSLVESMMRGETTFEVIKHQHKRRKIPKQAADMERYVFRQIHRELLRHGYHTDGFYLEFGQPALRYEGESTTVGLLFSENAPPMYVVRRKGGKSKQLLIKDQGETNPFKQLNYPQGRVDDKTRLVTETSVHVPNMLRIPEATFSRPISIDLPVGIKERYRALIAESSRRPQWDLRKAGLAYK